MASRVAGTLALALAACTEKGEEHVVVETERLVVELYDSDVLCRGSLENMERQLERSAALLGAALPARVRVRYGWSAAAERCLGAHDGCTNRAGEIAATEVSVYHELVHAVRLFNGWSGVRFFEEGIADVLAGFRPYPYQVSLAPGEVSQGPVRLLERPWSSFGVDDYKTAGHFMSWLRSVYGDDVLVGFLNLPGDVSLEAVSAAFREHVGVSIEDAEAQWRVEAAPSYAWGDLCEPSRRLPWSGASLEFAGDVDCAEAHVVGPGHDGRISTFGHCFTLEQPAVVRVEVEADASRAFATIRQFGCSRDPSLDIAYYDLAIVYAGAPQELVRGACEWEISVTNPGNLRESRSAVEPIGFSVRLTRI